MFASTILAGVLLASFLSGLVLTHSQKLLFKRSAMENGKLYFNASGFSTATVSWITPLIHLGSRRHLESRDIRDLRKSDTTATPSHAFKDAWTFQLEHEDHPKLWNALISTVGRTYLMSGLFKIIQEMLAILEPQLLRCLITFVNSYRDPKSPVRLAEGVSIALALFVLGVTKSVVLHQHLQRIAETEIYVRSSLASAVYEKSLRLSVGSKSSRSRSEIVNHMIVDTQIVGNFPRTGLNLCAAPFRTSLCLLSLYELLGPSMFAGVGMILVYIKMNSITRRLEKSLKKRHRLAKSARAKLVSQILDHMRCIKIHSWTTLFLARLDSLREEKELPMLQAIGATRAVVALLQSAMPTVIFSSSFTLFAVIFQNHLSAEVVFPAIVLFSLIASSLTAFGVSIGKTAEASHAMERLTSYLMAAELDFDHISPDDPLLSKRSVYIRDASFSWTRNSTAEVLRDINFIARPGEMTCVLGRMGTGKSSFLAAMLGELHKTRGKLLLRGTTAYVSDTPWIMNATARENIVFGNPWNSEYYEGTIKACALEEDFANLADGDATQVGERGLALSGGQIVRLALARAVYARSDIYILDNILSAVDQNVAKHLVENVLSSRGLLASKTRIVASDSPRVLSEANYVVLLENGQIVEQGTREVSSITRKSFAGTYEFASEVHRSAESAKQTHDSFASVQSVETPSKVCDFDTASLLATTPPSDGKTAISACTTDPTVQQCSIQPHGQGNKKLEVDSSAMKKEHQDTIKHGVVTWDVRKDYTVASCPSALVLSFTLSVIAYAALTGSNIWLKRWVMTSQTISSPRGLETLIGLYSLLGLAGGLLMGLSTFILGFCCTESSRKLFQRMSRAVLYSPLVFFETTPDGYILDTFISDISVVDETIPDVLSSLLNHFAQTITAAAVIWVSTPSLMPFLIPIGFLYRLFQRPFFMTSSELRRIESAARGSAHAHFKESLHGASTIRAYRCAQQFCTKNERKMDDALHAYFLSMMASRWIAIRLDLLDSIIVLGTAAILVSSAGVETKFGAQAGLTMSYALKIAHSFRAMAMQTAEGEASFVSVARVLAYADLPSEDDKAPPMTQYGEPPHGWPSAGRISFINYSSRYRSQLDPVLRNVNFTIESKQKIGVVGRTGAGKSSLVLALLRIIEAEHGEIVIDDINVGSMTLSDLRRRLAIVPQNASLLEGTVKENLDPEHLHDEKQLWKVLDQVCLQDYVFDLPGRLDAKIHEGGANLSRGHRQLIVLARALLTDCKVLVMDEATSAVDKETDAKIQDMLRSHVFGERTIMTITHRVDTVLDYDKIMVLQHGAVQEFDTPSALFRRKGMFYQLVHESDANR